MTELERLRALCEAGSREPEQRARVETWMDQEAREGRLRSNKHAPAWPAYEVAVRAQRRRDEALGSLWPALLALYEGAVPYESSASEDLPGGHYTDAECKLCLAYATTRAEIQHDDDCAAALFEAAIREHLPEEP